MVKLENVKDYKLIYFVSFYDGYIDGCKYSVEYDNTEYTGFVASVGTKYFATPKGADTLCKKLNKIQLTQAKITEDEFFELNQEWAISEGIIDEAGNQIEEG